MSDEEKALLTRIVDEVCGEIEQLNMSPRITLTMKFSVPETIALRKLRASFFATPTGPLLPKDACL